MVDNFFRCWFKSWIFPLVFFAPLFALLNFFLLTRKTYCWFKLPNNASQIPWFNTGFNIFLHLTTRLGRLFFLNWLKRSSANCCSSTFECLTTKLKSTCKNSGTFEDKKFHPNKSLTLVLHQAMQLWNFTLTCEICFHFHEKWGAWNWRPSNSIIWNWNLKLECVIP